MQVEVNGTRLWFDVDGSGLVPEGAAMRERPTVVLLHGGPGGYDHSYFKPDFGRLVEHAQVVYLDLRGHGRSDWGDAGAWSFEGQHDPFVPLVLASQRTESITLGTAIAVAFARNPMTTAYLAQDLQTLSCGRFVLGLGTQIKQNVEGRYSVPWREPVARMGDYIDALRAIFATFATLDDGKEAGVPIHPRHLLRLASRSARYSAIRVRSASASARRKAAASRSRQ